MPSPSTRSNLLRVATYNVQKGFGIDLRRDPTRAVQVIASLDADLVALQEADRRFGDRAGVFDLAALTRATGLHPIHPPHRSGALAHGWHGNFLLHRNATLHHLRPITLPGVEPRGALCCDITLPYFGPLRLITAHLAIQRMARHHQARLLASLALEATTPVILMGDLNEWRLPPEATLAPLSALTLAPLRPTYPAPFPLWPLDRIYVRGLTIRATQTPHLPLARRASDHLPLVAELQQPVDGQPPQQPPP